ncbi:di-heme oxidoreductase family protein [Halocola ammonii]
MTSRKMASSKKRNKTGKWVIGGSIIAIALITGCLNDENHIGVYEEGEELSAGEATVFDASQNAFGLPVPTLKGKNKNIFFVGNSLFNQSWVTAPSSTTARDGLGPLFNARACDNCHTRDGRGKPQFETGDVSAGFLMRLSIPGESQHGGPLPHPIYGGQLQGSALMGIPHEGEVQIKYETIEGKYADGTPYELRKPTYEFVNLQYGALGPDVLTSPRVGTQMIGLGLLEAIPEDTLKSIVDPNDEDGDGISGRINYVWDSVNEKKSPGRYGWKANVPTIREQVAMAFNHDIGITSSLFPKDESTKSQPEAMNAVDGGTPELQEDNFDHITIYSASLGVPVRRNAKDPNVLKGKALFHEIGCADCHRPKFETGDHPEIPELGNKTIRPFTDLLLHDMGPGLADGRPDHQASGSEWRTAPLWGIGLISTVNNHTFFLHDGRARNLEEAILWHGGEGEKSKEAFKELTENERQFLIEFLNSL